MTAIIDLNQSDNINNIILQYKTGSSEIECLSDIWHVYNGISFRSLGWVQLKINKI
jgi:hypothetical protein